MDYKKLFGWGIGIYAVMFLMWSAFVAYNFVDGFVPRIIGLAVLIGITYMAGRSLSVSDHKAALPYALGWVVIIAILDILLSVPFTGWEIFSDWNIWIGYAIVFAVPMLVAGGFNMREMMKEPEENGMEIDRNV